MKNPWEIQPQNTPNSRRESEQGEVVALVVHPENASEAMDNECHHGFREASIWCCQNDISIVYVCFYVLVRGEFSFVVQRSFEIYFCCHGLGVVKLFWEAPISFVVCRRVMYNTLPL
jgi:hypothetical protein